MEIHMRKYITYRKRFSKFEADSWQVVEAQLVCV